MNRAPFGLCDTSFAFLAVRVPEAQPSPTLLGCAPWSWAGRAVGICRLSPEGLA